MRSLGLLVAIIGLPIVAGTLIAGLLQASLRETTGIYDRWANQSVEDQQTLLSQAANVTLNPNESNRPDSPLPPDGNHDGDCLTNAEEEALGLDPRNPDSDGDGIDDCVDNGMTLEKKVNGSKETRAAPGDEVKFVMEAQWVVIKDEPDLLVFRDPKPEGLEILEAYYIFNSARTDLSSWPSYLEFPISGSGEYNLAVHVKARVSLCRGVIPNIATITRQTTTDQVEDDAKIVVIPPETRILFNRHEKTVNGEHWIQASIGDSLEFRIVTDFTFTTCDEERTLVIRDILTGKLDTSVSGFDQLIGYVATNIPGYEYFPLARVPSELEFRLKDPGRYQVFITFTGAAESQGLITNRAIAYEKEKSWNRVDDIVFVGVAGASGPALLQLSKDGRLVGTEIWLRYITAQQNNRVEFRIRAEIQEEGLSLIDALPKGLTYLPNTLKLYYEGADTRMPEFTLRSVFQNGLALDRGAGKYELYFIVRVDTEAPFSLTNTATIIGKFGAKEQADLGTASATVTS